MGNGSLTPICSLSNRSLSPSLTVFSKVTSIQNISFNHSVTSPKYQCKTVRKIVPDCTFSDQFCVQYLNLMSSNLKAIGAPENV